MFNNVNLNCHVEDFMCTVFMLFYVFYAYLVWRYMLSPSGIPESKKYLFTYITKFSHKFFSKCRQHYNVMHSFYPGLDMITCLDVTCVDVVCVEVSFWSMKNNSRMVVLEDRQYNVINKEPF